MNGANQIISGRLTGVRTLLHPRTVDATPLEMRGRYLLVHILNMMLLNAYLEDADEDARTVLCRSNSKWLVAARDMGAVPQATRFAAAMTASVARLHPALGMGFASSRPFAVDRPGLAAQALREADRDCVPKTVARSGFAEIALEDEPAAFRQLAWWLAVDIDRRRHLDDGLAHVLDATDGFDRCNLRAVLSRLACDLLRHRPVVPDWIEVPLPVLSGRGPGFGVLRMDATGFSVAAQNSMASGYSEHARFTADAEYFFYVTVKEAADAYGDDVYILSSAVDDIIAIGRLDTLSAFAGDVRDRFQTACDGRLRAGIARITATTPLCELTRQAHAAMRNDLC